MSTEMETETETGVGTPVRSRSRWRRCGFSMVEVVVAVGITGFALLALVGLLPHGIETMREAANISAEARISQYLVGEVMLSEWEEIGDFDGQYRYFDNQSIEVFRSNPDFDSRHVYTAQLEVPAADVQLPNGGAGGGAIEENLRRVVVRVTDVDTGTAGGDEAFFNDESRKKRDIRTYASIVAKMNR